jgi:hypothetical protein
MGHALCATPESHLLAEIIPTFPADSALPTWDSHFECDSITNMKAIDLRSNAHYYAGRFMPKRQWCAGAKVSIGKFLVVADIRSANASRLYLDLKLPDVWIFDSS